MDSSMLDTTVGSSAPDSGLGTTYEDADDEWEPAGALTVRHPTTPVASPLRDKIFKFKFLTSVGFANNNLTSVPQEFLDQEHLSYVDLSHNRLTDLGETFGSAHSVRHLDVSHNLLTNIPSWMNRLPQVKVLDLSYNSMGGAESLASVTTDFGKVSRRLRFFNLSNCGLIALGAALFTPRDMTHLILGTHLAPAGDTTWTSNVFWSLPSHLSLSVGLVSLVAPNMELRELPEEIGLLKNLRHLDVHNNLQFDLPAALVQLQRLEFLDASRNQLQCLPCGIEKMPRLRELHLAHNNLNWITQDLHCASDSLKILDLYDNKLDLQGAMSLGMLRLEGLDLGSNADLCLAEISGDMGVTAYQTLQLRLRSRLLRPAEEEDRRDPEPQPREEQTDLEPEFGSNFGSGWMCDREETTSPTPSEGSAEDWEGEEQVEEEQEWQEEPQVDNVDDYWEPEERKNIYA